MEKWDENRNKTNCTRINLTVIPYRLTDLDRDSWQRGNEEQGWELLESFTRYFCIADPREITAFPPLWTLEWHKNEILERQTATPSTGRFVRDPYDNSLPSRNSFKSRSLIPRSESRKRKYFDEWTSSSSIVRNSNEERSKRMDVGIVKKILHNVVTRIHSIYNCLNKERILY